MLHSTKNLNKLISWLYQFNIVILQYNSFLRMGLTKTEIFSDEHNNLAIVFKVLAHPARISIIQHIIDKKSCICNDLVEELGLAQATISQHLKELKNSGIIKGSISGKSVCYCIDEDVWVRIRGTIAMFFAQDVSVISCC